LLEKKQITPELILSGVETLIRSMFLTLEVNKQKADNPSFTSEIDETGSLKMILSWTANQYVDPTYEQAKTLFNEEN
jgi:hypothetical protein